ncbi:MAG: NAD-dependent epimerase/dehydratase family protein [Desulfuromusa sp.]|nr:NAD-dependent epimerase/dehydratase family protein [Desulfuromusa sp.]
MRVLVLGGTGAMGMHLVQLLSDKGVETVVTSRSHRSSAGNIRFLCGDAHDIEFVRILLAERWDAIVDFMVYSTSSFHARLDLLLGNTAQYFFLSSSRVYAGSKTPITEKSSRLLDVSDDEVFLATDEYSLAKSKQEDLLKQSGRKNWTIIRPYITYGENRLQLGVLEKEEWLYRALKGRVIVFSSDILPNLTTMTYGHDVAKGIAALIGNSSAFSEAFHITAEKPITWEDVLEIYLDVLEKHLGHRPQILLRDLGSFLKCKPAKYQIIYDRLYDRVFDSSHIYRYVDKNEFVQVDEGLRVCLERFLENPRFKQIDWMLEAEKDRQAKEHTSLKEIPSGSKKLAYLLSRYFGLSGLVILLKRFRHNLLKALVCFRR